MDVRKIIAFKYKCYRKILLWVQQRMIRNIQEELGVPADWQKWL